MSDKNVWIARSHAAVFFSTFLFIQLTSVCVCAANQLLQNFVLKKGCKFKIDDFYPVVGWLVGRSVGGKFWPYAKGSKLTRF